MLDKDTLYSQVKEAVQYLRKQTDFQAEYGIVLGTGLNKVAEELGVKTVVPYSAIPHFPKATVASHEGKMYFGTWAGKKVVALAGRFHYYEGYTMQQVTFPIRVLKHLGIEQLILSNAAGGLNPIFQAGDLVCVKDHINLQPANPLRGPNDERLGPRFPDMLHTYDTNWNARALKIAKVHQIRAHLGVYAALPGPNLETAAEYEYLHRIGADLVGMSTVPEVLVARHMDLPVFVLSVVSNQCYPIDTLKPTTLEEVIQVASEAEPKMSLVLKGLLERE